MRIDYSSPEKVTIQGLTATDGVKVYDMTGKQLPVDITSSGDAVQVSLANLSRGVYIITIPNHPSIKIKK